MKRKLTLKFLLFIFIISIVTCGCSQSQAQNKNANEEVILLDDLIESQRLSEENESEVIDEVISDVAIENESEEIIIPEETEGTEETEEIEVSDISEAENDEETYEEIEEVKYVCLTFDDGPHKTNTQQILDLLKEYDAVATFFEVGKSVDAYPELVKAEIDQGCEVENHTYSHINMKNSSYDTIISEINKCNEAIYNAAGVYPIFVRPPYGNINKEALSACSLASTNWSVDTRDWESRDKDKIMEVIKNEGDLSGQVILMHSTHKTTVEALELLLPYLEENGYKTVTLKEMFENVYGEEIVPGAIYGYSYYAKK